jgi:protein ImuA
MSIVRLHPAPMPELKGVWRASQLGAQGVSTVDAGFAALNAVLPGGGWPVGALIELLQQQDGLHEWGLLAPALADQPGVPGWRPLVLIGAPHQPFGPALAAHRLDPQRLLCVQGGNAATQLWATVQALQCADVAAVLAWLPQARSAQLRHLQMAALEHGKLLFVFRPLRVQHESSPAPLRLCLQEAAGHGDLQVRVLKRRGPPLLTPLCLSTRPARLLDALQASHEQARRRRLSSAMPPLIRKDDIHAVDRLAATSPS